MTTWQIFSGYGDSFRWEITGRHFETEPEHEPRDVPPSYTHKDSNSSPRLPSTADLLLQGCAKLLEDDDNESVAKTPMFKTGLGRFVPVKKSSVAKALSVLGEDSAIDTGQMLAGDNVCDFSNSLFQTGSGKMVNISSDGLARAKTLLGLGKENDPSNFQGFQDSRKLSDIDSRFGQQNVPNLEKREGLNHFGTMDGTSLPRSSPICRTDLGYGRFRNEAKPHPTHFRMHNSAITPSPIKFQTAGGRSISVSSDALQRARSLLGDPELGVLLDIGNGDDQELPLSKKKELGDCSSNKENDPQSCLTHQEMAKSKLMSKNFISPMRSPSKQIHSSGNSGSVNSGTNLIRQFDAVSQDDVCWVSTKLSSQQERSSNGLCAPKTVVDNYLSNSSDLRRNLVGSSPSRQLVDISNTIGSASANNRQATKEERKIVRTSVSPFKRPRSSKFSTPMKSNFSFVFSGSSTFSSVHCSSKGRVSTRYPFPGTRIYVKEFFGVPPSVHNKLAYSSDQLRWIRSDNAERYTFPDDSGVRCIGAEDFFHKLTRSGASEQYASKEWVKNHYKWIVWKLACYERCYPTKAAGKILTVSNVLEELKYRYEREVNHGHRSAIKRILEGDASPSSMMVLCISAICSSYEPKIEVSSLAQGDAEKHSTATAAKVELTDGWYSVDAVLDVLLLKQLASGKLFVGQKLRIWGAGFSGWIAPVSPLEVPRTVNLVLHINGTYRARWAERLGFCKGVPLAFKCIKSNGGPVPLTLVGITRIYPLLYRERLTDGRSVVRSERLETKVVQSYNDRRSIIIESIVSDYQRGTKHSHIYNDSDSEDGAKIWKILEKASQPEVLLADMSSDQISSFAKYQANMEAIRQSDMEKSIEKALENAGLSKREVIPFMRLRVVGLTSKTYEGENSCKEGLITIWNPTEKQKSELIEGKAYNVSGLIPISTDAHTIYLQARGPTTWQSLSLQALEHFKPFFTPRKSVPLSNFGAIPLSSEFDIAAFVVFIGAVYKDAHQKKQWVFVTDSSIIELQSDDFSDCLLAICFCSTCMDDESFVPFNFNLAGSTVGFCNLIKRAKDQVNHLWVAEASENSTYFLSFDTPECSHLKNAVVSAERWGKFSHLTTNKLKEKILFIIGDGKA